VNITKEFDWSNQVYVIGNGRLRKDPNSHFIFIDLLTCWIAKPYPLPPFYHNCTIFQLVAITNNIPSFQWLIVESNVSYVQEIATNILASILCMG
jgi:hypothetical protein